MSLAKPIKVLVAVTALFCVSVAPDRLADTSPLSVCFPTDDPPRSVRADTAGFDLDIARFVAGELQRGLRIVWLPERGQTDLESSDIDFRPLLTSQCDAQFSVPGIGALGWYGSRLELSRPYYGAAFELIPETANFRWGEPYAETVAVRSNTVAHLALDAIGVRWTMQGRTADVVQAVHDGSAAAALIWGPDLALLDVERDSDFEPPAVLRWNLHAVTRRGDALLTAINRVFESPSFQRETQRLMRRHGIPAHPPFATVYTLADLNALRAGEEN